VLGQKLLAQLDVLVVSLLLAGAGVNDLLPLVVLGLALLCTLAPAFEVGSYSVGSRFGEGWCKTYSQVEHAGLLCGAEIVALGDLGVCVELSL
jgi:hypothetical protein